MERKVYRELVKIINNSFSIHFYSVALHRNRSDEQPAPTLIYFKKKTNPFKFFPIQDGISASEKHRCCAKFYDFGTKKREKGNILNHFSWNRFTSNAIS